MTQLFLHAQLKARSACLSGTLPNPIHASICATMRPQSNHLLHIQTLHS
jgi:hypothetical protein